LKYEPLEVLLLPLNRFVEGFLVDGMDYVRTLSEPYHTYET